MTKTYLRDLAERVATTFAFGSVSVLAGDATDLTSIGVWRGAALAGGAAALSLLKGLLAKRVGNPDSAGL